MRAGQQAQRWQGFGQPVRFQIKPQRGFQRRERHFVAAQRAFERVLLNLVYPFALADDQAGLRPAQQLVAGEADQVHAGGDHLLRHRLVRQAVGGQVDQRAGAQVGGHRQAAFARQFGQFRLRHAAGEALNRVIAGVDLEQEAGFRRDRVAIVLQVSAVGGAHFHQPAAGLAHHVRHAEGAAYLHHLAAGQNDLAAGGHGGQHDEHRRRVIVDHAGGFGAGEFAQ